MGKITLKKLANKKIAVLGLGLENLALVRYLLKHKVKCEITVCDKRDDIKRKWIPAFAGMTKKMAGMTKIGWQVGREYNKGLEKFDILFRSPGWPIDDVKSKKLKAESINSPMRLFFELCPTRNIIGVTGTKGKGTTASLICAIFKAAGKRIWLGGNIGVAPFEFLDKIKKNDWVVLELSSFQLEDMTVSPRIAVITNFYSEHLAPADPNNPNYHKTIGDYWKAKMNIVRWQKKNDYSILNQESGIRNQELNTKGKKIYFSKSELPLKLIGEHNKENAAAAVEVAKIAGVKPEVVKQAAANFKSLEHRLEFVRKIKGVKYYDDSFATTPESTIIALKSFSAPLILLLGGADKGADFKKLAKEVKRRCKFVVLLKGVATPRIKKELLKAGFSANKMKLAGSIIEAVKFAGEKAAVGDVILLSTACASFGMFKNYKERGNLFKKEVNKL